MRSMLRATRTATSHLACRHIVNQCGAQHRHDAGDKRERQRRALGGAVVACPLARAVSGAASADGRPWCSPRVRRLGARVELCRHVRDPHARPPKEVVTRAEAHAHLEYEPRHVDQRVAVHQADPRRRGMHTRRKRIPEQRLQQQAARRVVGSRELQKVGVGALLVFEGSGGVARAATQHEARRDRGANCGKSKPGAPCEQAQR
eukprot:2530738-Prymnesium_polylepis.2